MDEHCVFADINTNTIVSHFRYQLTGQCSLFKFKGIDQWEKGRVVIVSGILAEIIKQIGAGPILWEA